jgi:alpha-glucosidase
MVDTPIPAHLVQDPLERNVPGFNSGAISTQANDPRSMLSLYRALIRLRRNNEVLLTGDLQLLTATEHVLAYERRLGCQRVMVALNMTGQARSFRIRSPAQEILLSTYLDDRRSLDAEEIHLRADEGLVVRAPADIT